MTTETAERVETHVEREYARRMMVFAGRSSLDLGRDIATRLGLDPGEIMLKSFANGEIYASSARASAAPTSSSCSPPAASPAATPVVQRQPGGTSHHGERREARERPAHHRGAPWYGYSRQDKKSAPREPITAKMIADMLQTVGVDRVLTMDLHAGQVQGFFNIPVDHMTAVPILVQYFRDAPELRDRQIVVVSPDAGRAKLATHFAEKLGAQVAVLTKQRPEHGQVEMTMLIGDVVARRPNRRHDRHRGTLVERQEVREMGATGSAARTHGLFSDPASSGSPATTSSGSSSRTQFLRSGRRISSPSCPPGRSSPTASATSSTTNRSPRSSRDNQLF